ncbi:MAG: hypothetical protein JW818_07210 [Pirellulales bacterium]|nr:hypothetical protein [Pirellulales bacterium]
MSPTGCLLVLLAALGSAPNTDGRRPFAIEVVDSQTGRGVPLVELRTAGGIRFFTDSAGIVAFDEPGLMDQKVFFHVSSHGYEYPKDGFGFRGKALEVTPGGRARIEIRRVNIAQRLYRITGGGIYRDSVLVGRKAPLAQPLLDGQVLGCDGTMRAVLGGRIHWFWGDTNRPSYPLGNFKTTGATSRLPNDGGLDPAVGVNLDYFLGEDGFVKKMIAASDPGPTWISGTVVLRDTKSDKERLFAHYANIRGGDKPLETYEKGLVEFNPATETFKKVATFPLDAPFPDGAHTLLHAEGDRTYIYFCDPFPRFRVLADSQHLARIETYEGYTCFVQGTRKKDRQIDRRPDGSIRWAWKANTGVPSPKDMAAGIKAGVLPTGGTPWMLRDAETGAPVIAHRGSIARNAYRRRWIMIFCEVGGTSMLGEIWYAEADHLTGPWQHVRKIVTHDRYSFYNPVHHPFFDKDGGRQVFFEGTYTHTFSGNPDATPRYDYNQIMYLLELDDPRLKLSPRNTSAD